MADEVYTHGFYNYCESIYNTTCKHMTKNVFLSDIIG